MPMVNDGKPWLNGSGYYDPTAYKALENVNKQQSQNHVDDSAHMVISTIRNILHLSGFELIGRIQIKHKKSGKIYK